MTRQKKEIIKKIEEADNFIAADQELGCGFAPDDFYTPIYKVIDGLRDQLARLRGYKDADEEWAADMDRWEARGIPSWMPI